MATTLRNIKENIERWNTVRNQDSALALLTAGKGFSLTTNEFKQWSRNNPEKIHCYLGLNANALEFYLVDNLSDEQERYTVGENLFSKYFLNHFEKSLRKNDACRQLLEPSIAESRITNWTLCAGSWFELKKEKRNNQEGHLGEMVRVFTIPFEDLTVLFEDERVQAIKLILALELYDAPILGYDLELILAKSEFELDAKEATCQFYKQIYANTTSPFPPYSMGNNEFNLL